MRLTVVSWPAIVLVGVEGGEQDHLRGVGAAAQAFRGGEAVHRGHPDVHQDDVRAGALDEFPDLGAVGGLADDLDVVRAAHHQGQTGPDQRVVVDEEQSDRCHGAYVIMIAGAGCAPCG